MVKREKRALSGFLVRRLGSVEALRRQLRSDGRRCELVVIGRRCSAQALIWMDVNAALACGAQIQMGGEHSKLARGAQ